MVNLLSLENALKKSWNITTTSDPDHWSIENPAWGQCATTACVVQDYIGGKIVWSPAKLPNSNIEISHYFNKLGKTEYDFTRLQFPVGTQILQGANKSRGFDSTRVYVLSYENTRRRYELLKDLVHNHLKKK
jgi:hypothetical protein